MSDALGGMLAMAVGVALSPIPIIAVVLLLTGPNGRPKGIAYAIGSAVSTALLGGLLLAWDAGLGGGEEEPATRAAVVRIVVGLALVALAAKQWRGRPLPDEEVEMPSWMGALDGFTVPKALGAGVVLNVLNPKNLLLIVGGVVAVAGADASGGEEAVAWAVFTAIASLGVVTPVVIAYAAGDRAPDLLGRLRSWMGRNNGVIMALVLLLIGVKLLGDGIAGL